GGLVEGMAGRERFKVADANGRLPKGPFRVLGIRHEVPRVIDDKALDTFRELSGLEYLRLADALITDEGLARFAASPAAANLVDLHLLRVPISDKGLASLRKLRRLSAVAFAGCTSVTDAGLGHLRDLPLSHVHLYGTSVTSAGLAHLSGKKLTYLSLNLCQNVDDAGLAHLKAMTTLDRLDLYGTGVGNAGLGHIAGNVNLTVLNLS